jgi:hypothetical protein
MQYYNEQAFFAYNYGRLVANKLNPKDSWFKQLLIKLRDRILTITKNITDNKELNYIIDNADKMMKYDIPE